MKLLEYEAKHLNMQLWKLILSREICQVINFIVLYLLFKVCKMRVIIMLVSESYMYTYLYYVVIVHLTVITQANIYLQITYQQLDYNILHIYILFIILFTMFQDFKFNYIIRFSILNQS